LGIRRRCLAGVLAIFLLPGCSVNGRPMRFNPASSSIETISPARSWFIEGQTTNGAPISCSFVEFDVWSTTTMEMYAALYRAVESRRGSQR
jgi:hypothetical protein